MESIVCDDGSTSPHAVLFPFMAKGHTIPLLHLARFLLRRHLTVTVITTPANRSFIATLLQDTAANIIDIPFPDNVVGIPAGIESIDKLPSISLFTEFAMVTVHMQPHLERVLETLPHVSFMVSDGFFWWTQDSASKFGVPRLVFLGMSNYYHAVFREAHLSGILSGPQALHVSFSLTRFPWIRLSKDDFDPALVNIDPKSLFFELCMKVASTMSKSFGMIENSFYELEPIFTDYMNTESSPKSWCVGPLCLAEHPPKIYPETKDKPRWVQWLDKKLEEKCGVLYVAFGSQVEVSQEQLAEIATGLEESNVTFLWVIRTREWEPSEGFEERVKDRGMVVREWVDQREILMHECVQGFVSHCGWNSVLESICAGVPILAWPKMVDQPLNAKMVEEEIKVGLRVETCDGSVRGFVKWEELKKSVRELIEGEKGKEAREKAKELAEMARKAVDVGGSSWRTLEALVDELCRKKGRCG